LLPLVVAVLDNDYPLVRYFAHHAIEQITGAPLPIDMNAPGADVLKSAQVYLAAHPSPPSAGSASPSAPSASPGAQLSP
jgi:ethanolamine utilization microcompartment shell protein EutL